MSVTFEARALCKLDAGVSHAGLALSDRLRAWLVGGSAQSPSGAFNAWLDANTGQPAFEYPEITGYALTHLAGLNDLTTSEVAAGMRAGRWLQDRVHRGDFAARDGWDGGAVYNFDLAMMCNGLLTFGSRLDVGGFLDVGLTLARRLHQQAMSNGWLAALPVGAVSSRSVWSTHGTALMVKATQCLLSAAALDPSVPYAESACVVAKMAGGIQCDDGRIVTHPVDVETMCHPHLYAVEGLWAYASATGDKESMERAKAGAQWIWSHRLASGGFPRYVRTDSELAGPEQLDVTAQALRASVLTATGNMDSRADTVARIEALAVHATARTAAMPYQPAGPHLNVWVTLFAAQALELAGAVTTTRNWSAIV